MFYSKNHYRRLCPPPETAAEVSWSKRANEVTVIVDQERATRYPNGVTFENAAEVIAWQEKRIKELMGS